MVYSPPSSLYQNKEAIEANPVGIDYQVRNELAKQDFTNRIDKFMEKERLPWGFFGYTYLGQGKMWLNYRLDETPEFKKEVEVHEAIHTPDEYETRVISKDMIKQESRESIIKRLEQNYGYN